jgi:hypothetical protein
VIRSILVRFVGSPGKFPELVNEDCAGIWDEQTALEKVSGAVDDGERHERYLSLGTKTLLFFRRASSDISYLSHCDRRIGRVGGYRKGLGLLQWGRIG